MRTYTFAQNLINNELKGYHFTVVNEGTSQFDGWVVVNIEFFSVSPKNKDQEMKNLPICNIALFQIHQDMKSVSVVAKVVKERQEIILQFKRNEESNGPARVPVENSEYMFFQDLVGVIKDKFNGTVIQEGKSDFFTLIQHFQWTTQKPIVQKQKKSLCGSNWTSIALWGIGSVLVLGVIGALYKKKQ